MAILIQQEEFILLSTKIQTLVFQYPMIVQLNFGTWNFKSKSLETKKML